MRVVTLIMLASAAVAVSACSGTGIEPSTTDPATQSALAEALAETTDASATTVLEPTSTAPPTTVAPTTTAAITTTAAAATTTRPSVASLPSGLFCRDLVPLGYGYSDAVAYWVSEGSPDRMDADGNGIPCETVYPESDVLAFWGDPLPTTTTMGGIEAVWWFSPMEPWEYPIPMSSDLSLYGSGCSPGTTTLPDGMWFGFVMRSVDEGIQFDLACLEVPDEGHATVLNDNATLRTVGVADGTVVHVLRMGGEFGGVLSFDEWRTRGCTTGVDTCPMWLFVNDGVVTDMVEVRLGPA